MLTNILRSLSILLLLLGGSNYLLAQSGNGCGNDIHVKDYFKKHPSALVHSYRSKKGDAPVKQAEDETCFIIPVVFHIFHDGGEAIVTPEQVQSALDRANKDFNLQNSDVNTIDPLFDPIKASLPIKFVLSKLGPNGNPTTGIIYHSKVSGFGGTSSDDAIAAYAWDNYKYLNIYIMEDLYGQGVTNNSGVAWYPNSYMSDEGIARIVYNHKYLGNTGSSIADSEFQSVFTHECGHYLNLIHVFEGEDCNGIGDEVDDTPTTNQSGAGCNATVCGHSINGENYMDYNVSCQKMFTQGQVQRMMKALDHPARNTLWQASNLIATGVIDEYCGTIPHLVTYSHLEIKEDIENNGTFSESVKITLTGDEFKLNTTTEGVHYTITNLPNGLTARLKILNTKQAELFFDGNAIDHENTHSINTIQFELLNNIFVSNNTSNLSNTTAIFSISYIDHYQVICEDITDSKVDNNDTWESINLGVFKLGLWIYNNNQFKIEFYDNELAVTSGNNIQLLQQGDLISSSNNWFKYDYYPNQHDLYNPTEFTNWLGKEGYAAIRFIRGGQTYYGWLMFEMSSDGQTLTFKEWGYNSTPEGSIEAGSCRLKTVDCANIYGGTAYLDNCDVCVGGNTENIACVPDCNGDYNGTAYLDICGVCVSGNTGILACTPDCNGDYNGTAVIDNCGDCSGGKTGKATNTSCSEDCNGDWNGTAYLDICGICVEGNTNKTAETNLSNCITTSMNNIKEEEITYTNPIENELLINNTQDKNWSLIIIDEKGNIQLKSVLLPGSNKINTKNLSSGSYILKIISLEESYKVKILKI